MKCLLHRAMRAALCVPLMLFLASTGSAEAQTSEAAPLTAAPADDDLTMMDPDRPIECYRDTEGQVWRVQCNEASGQCLYAPNRELNARGEPFRALERTRGCEMKTEVFSRAPFAARGLELVPGLADAPHGWMRDGRGRLFQVEFDLKRRLYVGVAYGPRFNRDGSELNRVAVDVGLLSYERTLGNTRHRLRLVEGSFYLDPFSGRMVLLHYDLSRRYTEPLVRVTTFFGRPRRTDVGFNLGAWVEAGDLEIQASDLGEERLLRYATAHATVDLWQSSDLYSFVRLRGGVGVEGLMSDLVDDPDADDSVYAAITPGGAIEADLTLDRGGFHHIAAEIGYENPLYIETHPRLGTGSQRYHATLEYEFIAVALNDQPLSVFLSAHGYKRDDLAVLPTTWAAEAKAGLRFSLWAPPR